MMEKNIILNIIEDKYKKFTQSYMIVSSDFLDLAQGSAVAPFVKAHEGEGAFFYGGYEEAQRRQVVFVPDYTGVRSQQELIEYFRQNPEDCPLAVLEVRPRQKGASLRHSDYMGSLLSLGIKREKTGDIMVLEEGAGAQIFVQKEIAPYLAENYFKAGNVSLDVKVLSVSELVVAKPRMERLKLVISSLRLDNAVAGAFGVSRKTATEAIASGLVFVDSLEVKKPDFFLKGGEKIVLRGKGKVVFIGVSGTSRKGKTYAEFDRYI